MKKILLLTIVTLIFLPSVTFAQKYLVNFTPAPGASFDVYINLLYKMAISLAALLAVVKIVIAGAKYMLSDIVTNKSEAKKDIQGALLGLLLIAGAVIVLNTINPALTDGGLNIRKIVVPELDITSPVAAVSQISAALPACATKIERTTTNNAVIGIDLSKCKPEDNPTEIMRTFLSDCKAKGGKSSIATTEGGGSNLGCEIPLRVEKYAVDSVSYAVCEGGNCQRLDPDPKYLKADGNKVTYDAEAYCTDKFPNVTLSTCLDEVYDEFINDDDWQTAGTGNTYCQNNAGKYDGSARFTCTLPTKTLEYDKATTMYKSKYPEASFVVLPQEDYERMCQLPPEQGGLGPNAKLVDTHKTGTDGPSDYMCAVY